MFGRHYDNQLTAYLHGELSDSATEKVRIHINSCEACRVKLEELRFTTEALRSLPKHSAPDSVWERIEARIISEPVPESTRTISGFPWRIAGAVAVTACAAFVIALPTLRQLVRGARPVRGQTASTERGWRVDSVKGAPLVNSRELRGRGQLASGQWLETDSRSSATVKIADIGQAHVEPNSRLSLVSTAPNEHRMRLERGELHAKVTAPPRLFIVETPSATAVDLGCEYTLTANPDGSSLLKVMSGWVAMEMAARVSTVPATMACITRPTHTPGTPYRQDAPIVLIAALKRYDFEGNRDTDLAEVLKKARKVDGLTLLHLVSNAPRNQQRDIYKALNKLVPAPTTVSFEKAAAGDQDSLNDWKESIELVMFPARGFNFPDLAVNIMRMQNKGEKR